MTCRILSVIALVMGLVFLLAPVSAQTSDGLKPGVPLKGELGGDRLQYQHGGFNGTALFLHVARIPINLKAGQNVTLVASVVGVKREVVVDLRDPKGALIGQSPIGTKSTALKVEEVNATGQYTVVVGSPLIGPFTLQATTSAGEDSSVKSLETRVEQLERELADARAKLKAAKAKTQSSGGRVPSNP